MVGAITTYIYSRDNRSIRMLGPSEVTQGDRQQTIEPVANAITPEAAEMLRARFPIVTTTFSGSPPRLRYEGPMEGSA